MAAFEEEDEEPGAVFRLREEPFNFTDGGGCLLQHEPHGTHRFSHLLGQPFKTFKNQSDDPKLLPILGGGLLSFALHGLFGFNESLQIFDKGFPFCGAFDDPQ